MLDSWCDSANVHRLVNDLSFLEITTCDAISKRYMSYSDPLQVNYIRLDFGWMNQFAADENQQRTVSAAKFPCRLLQAKPPRQ